MKKHLLVATAMTTSLFLYSPTSSSAAEWEMTVGGYSYNYFGFSDQDTTAGTDTHEFDMQRETELHFNARLVADNGLTFNARIEMEADNGDDSNTIDENWMAISGSFGEVRLGSDDGAAYRLQVGLPAADQNIDGIRQRINPVNYDAAGLGGSTAYAWTAPGNSSGDEGFDYDNDFSGKSEKITYITPSFSGFQGGISYTFDHDGNGSENPVGNGFNEDDGIGDFGQIFEGGLRYQIEMANTGLELMLGLGFMLAGIESDGIVVGAAEDDYEEYNGAIRANFNNGFAVGFSYSHAQRDLVGYDGEDIDTYVAGINYQINNNITLGASYYYQEDESADAADTLDTQRISAGITYDLAPGIDTRFSLHHIDHDMGATDPEAVSGLIGLNIRF